MQPIPRARLTCVSNFPVATYSGMLPGVLAGQYEPEAMEIDLVRLSAAAGARLILGEVSGLDHERRELVLKDRSPIRFDALSIGIGSVPTHHGLISADETLVPIKPMFTFLARLDQRLRQAAGTHRGQPLQIVIAGGGVGGVEIAFCLPRHIERVLPEVPFRISIVEVGEHVGSGLNPLAATSAAKLLAGRHVKLLTGRRVTQIAGGQVWLDNGDFLPADVVLWATSASPPPLVARFDLPKDERGFLLTRPTLESSGSTGVFVVGDTGTIAGSNTPKAGVFAVRQGPILWENLQRSLRRRQLLEYRPQRRFLKLLNTGDGSAIGEWGGHCLRGSAMWWLKDRIDRKFMDMYQDYRPMTVRLEDADEDEHAHNGERQMRCLGCGGKVGGSILSRVLARLDIPPHPDVPLGLSQPDDVALVQAKSSQPLAVTTDFFAPPLDDPYLVGRIAALHAASDVLAKGARPIAALAIATIPPGSEKQQEQLLYDLLAGGIAEFKAMGATLAGGHTIEGPQTMIGYTIIAEPQNGGARDATARIRTKSGVRPGDVLILTKPLGVGVLLAAHMQARLKAAWYQPLLDALLASNQPAALALDEFGIEAATDVTGFGLAGHLMEMLRASSASAELELASILLLPGAAELLASGLESTLAGSNRQSAGDLDFPATPESAPNVAALFDPQTCGGLLFGAPPERQAAILEKLAATPTPGVVIGRVLSLTERPHLSIVTCNQAVPASQQRVRLQPQT